MADSLAEVEAETLGDSLTDAQELVDTLAELVADEEVETPGDTRGDA